VVSIFRRHYHCQSTFHVVAMGLPLIYIAQRAGLLAEKINSPNKYTGCNKHVSFRLFSDLLDARIIGDTQARNLYLHTHYRMVRI
jgi:hypothetical protein